MSTYVLYLAAYFIFGLRIGGFHQFNYPVFFNKALYVMAIFLCGMLFFYSKVTSETVIDRIEFKSNNLIYYMQLLIMWLIFYYGKSGESIFTAKYGVNKIQTTTINEYFPIFYLMTILYSAGNKYKLFVVNAIMLLFCVKSLLFGSRGPTITLGLIYFIVFLEPRLNKFTLILFLVFGLLFMEIWGSIRSGGGMGDSIASVSHVFKTPEGHKGNADGSNQTDVFYAANRIIGLADIGILDMKMRMLAFAFFVVSFVVPFSVLPPVANLSSYLVGDYGALGGGLIFGYCYVWFSYFGVVLITFYINKVWNWLRTTTNQYLLIYSILAFSYMNGWFAYTPVALFKTCTWGVIYLLAITVFDSMLKRNKVRSVTI